MATHEDFTFPTFTNTSSSTIDSPPLWRLSPAASPDHHHTNCHEQTSSSSKESTDGELSNEEEDYKDCFPTEHIEGITQRKSFSCVENQLVMKGDGSDDEEEEEEKIDLLWEDFNNNENLLKRGRSSRLESSSSSSLSSLSGDHHHHHHHQHMVNMGCAGSLRLSKTCSGGALFSPRKPGSLAFMKVLKNLSLLHNSHKSVQNHNSCTPIRNHNHASPSNKFPLKKFTS